MVKGAGGIVRIREQERQQRTDGRLYAEIDDDSQQNLGQESQHRYKNEIDELL